MGARRVTQEAATSWVRGNGMGSVGSQQDADPFGEAVMIDIGLSGRRRYGMNILSGCRSDEMERGECEFGPTSRKEAPIWREAEGKERVDGRGACPTRDVTRRQLKVGLGNMAIYRCRGYQFL